MTDERMGEALWAAIAHLPRGAGVVFRHHATPRATRRALFGRVRASARRRRLLLLLAGPLCDAVAWRADGAHGRARQRRAGRQLIRTAPVHQARELAAARAAGVDAIFLSPVFATRSHPGVRTLGPLRFAALARLAHCTVIALGGMTAARARQLTPLGAAGWAAIDALSPAQRAEESRSQKRKTVPR